jgi:branched-chain amino acid transport system substrate-binding protein
MRRDVVIAALAYMLVGLAGAHAADDIAIGVIDPLSGGVAFDGQTDLNGAIMAVDEINAAGGVLGSKLKLFPEDGACNPGQSVAAAEKLINQNKVVAILSPMCSSATGAAAETARKYGVLMLSSMAGAPSLTESGNQWFFRATSTTALSGKYFGKALAEYSGAKKVAILATTDDWGRAVIENYGNAFKAAGVQVVATELFDRNMSDFTDLLTKVRASGADTIIANGGVQIAANITLQARQLGFHGPIVGEGSFATAAWAKLVGKFTDKVAGIIEWAPTIDDPANKKFVTDYRKLYDAVPTQYSATAYNVVYMLADALKRGGKVDRDAVRQAMLKTDFTGLKGNFKFNEKGQAYNFNMYLIEWKNDDSLIAATAVIAAP